MLSIRFFVKKEITLLRRYIVLFVTVVNVFSLSAQEDISKQLNDILISKDIKACKQIMQQITDKDISQMADSTLLDYYYLAAWNASEDNQMESKVDYLLKVKALCENKLGIHHHVYVYFEVIKAIGETYEELGKKDDALLCYEEGIIKGLAYSQANDKILKKYFKEICVNAAKILAKKGYREMADYIKNNSPLNYNDILSDTCNLFDQGLELFDQAIELSDDGKNQDAIKLLDKAKDIFNRCGTEGEDMMTPLYLKYLICYAAVGDIREVDRLLKTKKHIMFYDDGESGFVSIMGEVIASFLMIHYDIKTAQKYYQFVVNEYNKSDQKEIAAVEKLGKTLDFFVKKYAQIDSLKKIRSTCLVKDYKWGLTSLQLANLFIRVERYDDANTICKEIYKMSSKLNDDPENLHWFVLMNIADYYILKKDLRGAETYLEEQLSWLDSHNFATNAEERGWVYNKLGVAYIDGTNYEAANKMLLKAEKILLSIYKKESVEYATILHNRGRLAQLQDKLDEAKEMLTEAARIQKTIDGRINNRTIQYLNEVEEAIKSRL